MMFSAMTKDPLRMDTKMSRNNCRPRLYVLRVFAILLSIGAFTELRSQVPQQSPSQLPPIASSQVGQQLFSSSCAGCHGLDGRGGEHAPNIATSTRTQNLADAGILRIIHDGIPATGMPGFGARFNDGQLNAIVRYVRVLQGKQLIASLSGNSENGRALFFGRARCSDCHTIEGRGGFIASDLSGYGGTHTANEMERAITDPNRNLDPRRRTVIAITRDGRKFSGVARNEDNFSLQLQTLDGTFHLFDKSTLVRLDHEPRSLMPDDYGSRLSRSELNDLIRFVAGARAARPAGAGTEDE